MSTVVSKNVQIGADGTASNNFTAYQPAAPDGTLRIGNGNSGSVTDAITLTSAGNVGIGTTSPTASLNVVANTSSDALRITQTGSGNAFVVEDSTSPDSSPFAIDASGVVLVGNTTAQTISGTTPAYQQLGSGNYSAIWLGKYAPNASANYIYLSKSRSGTVGSNAVVSNNDDLGTLAFYGDDGTSLIAAATILGEVDGTPGTNDMPGRLVFSTTADGASSPSERLRITSAGNVGIGTTSPQNLVQIEGSSGTVPSQLRLGVTASGQYYDIGRDYTDGYCWFYGAQTGIYSGFKWATGGAERMRIDYSGNVGIGTTTARGLLEIVSGSANTNGDSVYALTVVNANRATATSTGIVTIQSNDSMAANLGGSVAFGGRYLTASTAAANWATISGRKENGTSGQVGGYMAFETRNTAGNIAERVRLTGNGELLVGTTSAPATLTVSGAGGTNVWVQNNINAGTGAVVSLGFSNANGLIGYVQTSGSTTSYITSSDYRLKTDTQPMTGASDRVLALNPVNFEWISSGERVDGFLAHEAAEVVPEAVSGEKDAVDAEGKPVYQGIDQSKLVPLLTAALQEALAKIESLEARLDAANL